MDIIVLLPTYNEAGNIEGMIKEILSLNLDIHVLVADDFSPDKTYEIVEKMALADKRVHLLLRKENRGRGLAGIEGFKKALDMGASYIVEMDADHSHPPRFIRDFAGKIKEADIVIGSRYVSGGKDEKRDILRRSISAFARNYLSFILGIKIYDPTSGFRMFKKEALIKILPFLKAKDPFIITEVLYYAKKFNLKIVEVPIEFMPRETGESKLKPTTLFKYLFRVLGLKIKNV